MKQIICVLVSLLLILQVFGCDKTSSVNDPSLFSSEDLKASAEIYKRYDGITVTIATFRDPEFGNWPVGFYNAEKNHGIKISGQLYSQVTIIKEVQASIAAGTQADILDTYGTNFFGSLSCLQPLSSTGLDLEKTFQDRSILKASTVNGEPYLANGYGNPFNYVDLCIYNKSLFKKADIPTPKEFCDNGEWTLEKFKWCAEKISALGDEYIGAGVLDNSPYAIARGSFFELKNGKFTRSSNETLSAVLGAFSEMIQKGVIRPCRDDFGKGYQGMALTNNRAMSRGMYSVGYGSVDPSEIGVTYLPVTDSGKTPGFAAALCGWGIIKGSKNPEAAGAFLKSFLRPGKEALGTEYYQYVTDEFENFYFDKLFSEKVQINYYINVENMQDSKYLDSDFAYKWTDHTVTDINAYYKDKQEDMQKVCDEANKLLKQAGDDANTAEYEAEQSK